MRVGILTFARSINYGAFLQCYSLSNKLNKIDGIEVMVINYNTLNTELYYALMALLGNPIRGLRRYSVFRKCLNSNLKLTKKSITNSCNKAVRYINSLDLDVIVIGSDEVWKIDLARKYPNVYWKSSGVIAEAISYAASANKTDIDNLTGDVLLDMQKELQGFAYLGVRDDYTYYFLKELSPEKEVYMNCDPTFLYEFEATPNLRKRLVEQYRIDLEKPIIGLATENRQVTESIRNSFGDTHQLVAIAGKNKYADRWLYDLSPFEWANVYKYFSGCVTEYFHGTIFSILNNLPFVSFDRKKYALTQITKIEDLLTRAELKNNYCNALKEDYETITIKLSENMSSSDSFDSRYKEFIKKEREKYLNFETSLKSILGTNI